jgi:hypothetical protein
MGYELCENARFMEIFADLVPIILISIYCYFCLDRTVTEKDASISYSLITSRFNASY